MHSKLLLNATCIAICGGNIGERRYGTDLIEITAILHAGLYLMEQKFYLFHQVFC